MWLQSKLNKYIFPHFVLYFILSKKKISGHLDYSLKQGHQKQSLVLNGVEK